MRSEDELGLKWDRCVADTIIKTGEREREREIQGERGGISCGGLAMCQRGVVVRERRSLLHISPHIPCLW